MENQAKVKINDIEIIKPWDYTRHKVVYISQGWMFAKKGKKFSMDEKDVIQNIDTRENPTDFNQTTLITLVSGLKITLSNWKLVESNINHENVESIEIEKVTLEDWIKI